MNRFEFYSNLGKFKTLKHSNDNNKYYAKIDKYYQDGRAKYFWSKEEYDAFMNEKKAIADKNKKSVDATINTITTLPLNKQAKTVYDDTVGAFQNKEYIKGNLNVLKYVGTIGLVALNKYTDYLASDQYKKDKTIKDKENKKKQQENFANEYHEKVRRVELGDASYDDYKVVLGVKALSKIFGIDDEKPVLSNPDVINPAFFDASKQKINNSELSRALKDPTTKENQEIIIQNMVNKYNEGKEDIAEYGVKLYDKMKEIYDNNVEHNLDKGDKYTQLIEGTYDNIVNELKEKYGVNVNDELIKKTLKEKSEQFNSAIAKIKPELEDSLNDILGNLDKSLIDKMNDNDEALKQVLEEFTNKYSDKIEEIGNIYKDIYGNITNKNYSHIGYTVVALAVLGLITGIGMYGDYLFTEHHEDLVNEVNNYVKRKEEESKTDSAKRKQARETYRTNAGAQILGTALFGGPPVLGYVDGTKDIVAREEEAKKPLKPLTENYSNKSMDNTFKSVNSFDKKPLTNKEIENLTKGAESDNVDSEAARRQELKKKHKENVKKKG